VRINRLFIFLLILSAKINAQTSVTDSLLKIAVRVDHDSASKLYAKIANIFTGVNSDSVRKYARTAQKLSAEGSVAKGDVLIQLGNSYHMENNMDSAISYYKAALDYFNRIKNDKGVGKVYQSFALVKNSLGDYEGAIENSKKALAIYEKINWTVGMVGSYQNIGTTYHRLNKKEESVIYGRKAFSASKALNDSLRYFSIMADYGSKLAYAGRSDSAAYYIRKASKYLERNNMYNLLIPVYSNFATVLDWSVKSNLKFAKQALYAAKNYAYLSNAQDNLKYIYKDLALLYLRENKNDSAQLFFLQAISVIDSLNYEQGIQATKEIETKYETEKRELQIEKQALQIESSEKENAAKNRLLIIGVIALLSIAVFAFFAYKNFLKVKKANVVIQEQKLQVEKKNTEIQEQKSLIEEKQIEILDSINYAKRLQEAILPPQSFIDKQAPSNFVFYKPKDIVAGDFYWAEFHKGLFYIAVADSTGHGVPGALVSVVCSNALNRSLKEFNIADPGKILDKTRELVVETFEKSENNVQDGMDISLLCIDTKNKKIRWSGAFNSLWYIIPESQSGSKVPTLMELKADKQAVAKTDTPKPFTTHEITHVENAVYYLFSDGFADQFGGPFGKKFKYKPFSDLLLKIHALDLKQQKLQLTQVFEEWKGTREQTDDVCVIALQV